MAATLNSAYATIKDWCDLSGMGRAKTYNSLSRGELRAKKAGKRTLIDVQHGLRWLRSQPDAEINLKRAQKRLAASQAVLAP